MDIIDHTVFEPDETVFKTDQNVFVHDRVDGVDILRVYVEVDLSSVAALETALQGAATPNAQILVDLQPCTFIDSSVLAALIRAEKTYQGRFGLILPEAGPVRRIFTITSLLEHFKIAAAI